MAQNIFQSGFGSFPSLASATVEDVMSIAGYKDKEKAEEIIATAKTLLKKYEDEGIPVPTAPQGMIVDTGGDAKTQADQRLKEELAQYNSAQDLAKANSDSKESVADSDKED